MEFEYKPFKLTAKQKKLLNDIRKDMMQQLTENEAEGHHLKDLVEDYIRFCEFKLQLFDDIQQRGTTCSYDNGGGQRGWKKNDSLQEVLKVNMQMLKILDALKLKPSPREQEVTRDAPPEI